MATPTRPKGVPASAVYWRGHWFDPQTAAMLQELAAESGSDMFVQPLQGCWSLGKNSAETHARACVVDVDAEDWTDAQATWAETKWRQMGGFGWFRPRVSPAGIAYGWQRHLHLAHPDGDMAPELRNQLDDYRANRNGLANNGPDSGTRAYVNATWATYNRKRDDMFTDQDRAQLARIEQGLARVDAEADGRYKVDTGRYQHLAGLLQGRTGELDPKAVADAIPEGIAQAVVDALAARLQGTGESA